MKALPLLALALVGCVSGPSATEIRPDKTIVRYSTGQVFMARRKNTVSEVRGPGGIHLKTMSEEESSEDVPIAGITALGAKWLAKIQGNVTMNKDNNATAEVLGSQGVQRNKDTLDAAGKATSEALPLVEGGPQVLPIKAPGS